MEINAYKPVYGANIAENVKDLKIQKEESLGMNDFLNLIVAQMTNQDPMNPMENTDFIAQMAQFSSLEAMSDLREVAMEGQATSLIGKNVVVASYDSKGELEVQEGIVQRVTIFGGEARLYVNDKEYGYSNVMEIKETGNKEDPVPENPDPEDPSDGESDKEAGQ